MPDRAIETVAEWRETIFQALVFVMVGVLIAIGQIMQAAEPITWRAAIGRCITTGGIALVAGSVLTLFPSLPFISQVGIAAALASLGNSGLEMLMQRILNR